MGHNIYIVIISMISLSLIGALSGILLAYASDKFKVYIDPLVEDILKLLPRANCGACGHPGCAGLAEAIAAGKAEANACTVGGEQTAKAIAERIGKGKVDLKERFFVHVFCGGGTDKCAKKFQYEGIKDCDAVLLVGGGDKTCSYGCLGYGNCVRACKFDAMKMNSYGMPVIEKEKCVSCGKCIASCPRKIIGYIPKSGKIAVDCSTKDKGPYVRKICKVGCIGCKLCQKACKYDAISFRNVVPIIDYKKCTACLECVKVCPPKTIVEI
jgi:electron transport complex protein RnfB